MKRWELLKKVTEEKLTLVAVMPALGVSYRQAQRLKAKASVQGLRGLGHSTLTMVRRYAEVTQSDLVEQHRQFSPGDRFLSQVQKAGGRERLR